MEEEEINLDLEDIQVGDEGESLGDEISDNTTLNDDDGNKTVIDEDDIKIGDKKAPIVMLFGPPTSGKSMTLVRLARYLRKQGYTVKADPTFKSDDTYKERCAKFHKNLNTTEALLGNALNEFLMV